MKAIIQRVSSANVEVAGKATGSIDKGLLLLVGFNDADTASDLEWMVRKVTQMRLFGDAEGKMNLSLIDTAGEVLVVSQFTLFASTKKGNRPSFTNAAHPEMANLLYEQFKSMLSDKLGKVVASGVFGANMQVSLVNDGPVTISLDSQNKE